MADAEQLAILKEGVELWNAWREQNPKEAIELDAVDLSNTNLESINLSGANLEGADLSNTCLDRANLVRARLRRANLAHASLENANLAHAHLEMTNLAFTDLSDAMLPFAHLDRVNLSGAHLEGVRAEDAKFRRANLSYTTLKKAVLSFSDFRHANLVGANVEGANLMGANLENANVSLVKFDTAIFIKTLKETRFNPMAFWGRFLDLVLGTTMRCKGIHAVACYGSQRFKLFLQDQDYLEELLETRSGKFWCLIWWLFADCGRSLMRWAAWSSLFAMAYCCVYYVLGRDYFHVENMQYSFITALYYSIVTFTTLGFGDITPKTNISALIVSSEVVLGYVMLGGLISIFSSKLSRRGS